MVFIFLTIWVNEVVFYSILLWTSMNNRVILRVNDGYKPWPQESRHLPYHHTYIIQLGQLPPTPDIYRQTAFPSVSWPHAGRGILTARIRSAPCPKVSCPNCISEVLLHDFLTPLSLDHDIRYTDEDHFKLFLWMKTTEVWMNFDAYTMLLYISYQHWFRYRIGAVLTSSHKLNPCWHMQLDIWIYLFS